MYILSCRFFRIHSDQLRPLILVSPKVSDLESICVYMRKCAEMCEKGDCLILLPWQRVTWDYQYHVAPPRTGHVEVHSLSSRPPVPRELHTKHVSEFNEDSGGWGGEEILTLRLRLLICRTTLCEKTGNLPIPQINVKCNIITLQNIFLMYVHWKSITEKGF